MTVETKEREVVCVWDTSNPTVPDFSKIVLWRGELEQTAKEKILAMDLVEASPDIFREKYLKWVHELGNTELDLADVIESLRVREDFSYWWMTRIVEKSNYDLSPHIDDAIKLIAFYDWFVENKFEGLCVFTENKELAKCFKALAGKLKIPVEVTQIKTAFCLSLFDRMWSEIRPIVHLLTTFIWLLKYLFERRKLINVGKQRWQESEAEITLVSPFLNLDRPSLAENRYQDIYWGSLPKVLCAEGKKINWLHQFIPDTNISSYDEAARVLNRLNNWNDDGQTHAFVESFLTPRIIKNAIRDFFRIQRPARRANNKFATKQNEYRFLWPLFTKEFEASSHGKIALENLLNVGLFEAAFSNLSQQKIGLYLLENQPWELALIAAWKRQEHLKLVGFPHTIVRYWDLRYGFSPLTVKSDRLLSLPKPDVIVASGPVNLQVLKKCGYSARQIIRAESLRFNHLLKNMDLPPFLSVVGSQDQALRLLVVFDYDRRINQFILAILSKTLNKLAFEVDVNIKPHPASPIKSSDLEGLRVTVAVDGLDQLILKSDVVATSAPTAGVVNACLAGKKVITIYDPSRLDLSPMRGFSGVSYAKNSSEFLKALDCARAQSSQVALCKDYFYLDTAIPLWRKIFEDVKV